MRSARLSQSQSLPACLCSNSQVSASRSSGAIRCDRAAAEVERAIAGANVR